MVRDTKNLINCRAPKLRTAKSLYMSSLTQQWQNTFNLIIVLRHVHIDDSVCTRTAKLLIFIQLAYHAQQFYIYSTAV